MPESTRTSGGGSDAAPRKTGGDRFDRPVQEIVVAAVLLLGFLYLRLQLDDLVRGRRGAAYLDPDFWPGWLLNVGILLALAYLVLSVLRLLRARAAQPEPSAGRTDVASPAGRTAPAAATPDHTTPADEPAGTAGELAAEADETGATAAGPEGEHLQDVPTRGNLLRLLLGFALLFGFIWLMPRIGFVPSALLFSIGFLVFAGERRWPIITLVPVGLLGVVLYVFTRLLVVPLPRGRGMFVELSTFFY
jgi:hypothetical protein